MADFAPPLINPDALPEWKPKDKDDSIGREIREYIRGTLQPKFDARKAKPQAKEALKDFVFDVLFPEVNKEFEVSTKYAVEKFKQKMYGMLNGNTNYKNRTNQSSSASASASGSGTKEKVRHRAKSGLDVFKTDKEQNQAIHALANERLEEKGRGKKLKEFNVVGKELYTGLREEERRKFEDEAVRRNAETKEGLSEAEVAKRVANNQQQFGAFTASALADIIGMGAERVGQAVFFVFGACKDVQGSVQTWSGTVGDSKGRQLTNFSLLDAEFKRLKRWGYRNLYTELMQDADTQELLLPTVDSNTLGKREIQYMLDTYFMVSKDEVLFLPSLSSENQEPEEPFINADTMSRRDLREYYDYAVRCQDADKKPIKKCVPIGEVINKDGGAGGSAVNSDANGEKSDNIRKPEIEPGNNDFSAPWARPPVGGEGGAQMGAGENGGVSTPNGEQDGAAGGRKKRTSSQKKTGAKGKGKGRKKASAEIVEGEEGALRPPKDDGPAGDKANGGDDMLPKGSDGKLKQQTPKKRGREEGSEGAPPAKKKKVMPAQPTDGGLAAGRPKRAVKPPKPYTESVASVAAPQDGIKRKPGYEYVAVPAAE